MPGKPMVSIVDDDSSVCEGLVDLLSSMGFAAEAFHRADEFLKSDRADKTSCLIADVHMPAMTGLELHRRLIEAGYAIPTILVTAHPDEDVRARALKDGVVCYLRKPVDQEHLLRCVRAALHSGDGDEENS